jgi:hypothetical protein
MSVYDPFESICYQLFKPPDNVDAASILDPSDQLEAAPDEPADVARQLNAAFLILLAGQKHPAYNTAHAKLNHLAESSDWSAVARFYLAAKDHIRHEIRNVTRQDQDFADRMKNLAAYTDNIDHGQTPLEVNDRIWSVFFPEGVGLSAEREKSVQSLRAKRKVTIIDPNQKPIIDPAREILFTSNVLLTLPSGSQSHESLTCREILKTKLSTISQEPQRYWYDHPIHIGVKPQYNELLYGLRGLDEALNFEHERGSTAQNSKMTCILSVSVTHQGLHEIARPYLEEELVRAGLLNNIDVYLFTEADTRRIISEVLGPSAEYYLNHPEPAKELSILGVDGEYGRHYSFLKAIAAFWKVFIQQDVKATFKIDLDQVFPQQDLVEQTGASAFEHFKTPLWGARGLDSRGNEVELGMIAGALVNESDSGNSIFTPDVRFPDRILSADEHIFFSALPQAISTEAEMMAHYDNAQPDGVATCLQRVHVTGGTNGIRIDSLRRHRPFTPSFIGRAEDQAYLLSALKESGASLAYVHKDGLIMRHDKEAFAQEAIDSAEIGRTVGDYLRILYFSAYAGVLSVNKSDIKDTFDPFTGCFISKIPITVAIMRFALKAATLFCEKKIDKGLELVTTGTRRILKTLEFVRGKDSPLKKQYENERRGWDLYYDTLDVAEQALQNKDPFALQLQQKARDIIKECKVAPQGRGQSA